MKKLEKREKKKKMKKKHAHRWNEGGGAGGGGDSDDYEDDDDTNNIYDDDRCDGGNGMIKRQMGIMMVMIKIHKKKIAWNYFIVQYTKITARLWKFSIYLHNKRQTNKVNHKN